MCEVNGIKQSCSVLFKQKKSLAIDPFSDWQNVLLLSVLIAYWAFISNKPSFTLKLHKKVIRVCGEWGRAGFLEYFFFRANMKKGHSFWGRFSKIMYRLPFDLLIMKKKPKNILVMVGYPIGTSPLETETRKLD